MAPLKGQEKLLRWQRFKRRGWWKGPRHASLGRKRTARSARVFCFWNICTTSRAGQRTSFAFAFKHKPNVGAWSLFIFQNEVRVHGARRKIGKTKAQAQIWRSHWWNGRNICAIVFSRFRWSFYLAWCLTDGLSGIIRVFIAKSGLNILAPGVTTNILKLPS